jgi:hypothetical protein
MLVPRSYDAAWPGPELPSPGRHEAADEVRSCVVAGWRSLVSFVALLSIASTGCGGGEDCLDAIWIDDVRYDNAYQSVDPAEVGELIVEVSERGCSDAAIGPFPVGANADTSVDGAATVLAIGTPIFGVVDRPDVVAAQFDGEFNAYKRANG